MSKHEPREVELRISDLVMDPNIQIRKKLNDGFIKRYVAVIKSEKEMPPIKVACVDKMYLLTDGWHRVEAHKFLGKPKIKALVLDMTRSEALWQAASANLEHGLPLSGKEIQEVFKVYIKSKQHKTATGGYKSFRQIGRELGKTHNTIISWMEKFFPKLYDSMGGDELGFSDSFLPPIEPSNFTDEVRAILDEAFEAFQATSDPAARGSIIDHAEGVVNKMKRSGGYLTPDF